MNIKLDKKKITKFNKHVDVKSVISVAINFYRIFKINIFHFHNVKYFKLYLKLKTHILKQYGHFLINNVLVKL